MDNDDDDDDDSDDIEDICWRLYIISNYILLCNYNYISYYISILVHCYDYVYSARVVLS